MRAVLAMLACLAVSPALAQGGAGGDAAAGEALFARQCVACHVIQDAGGEVLAGRNSQVGPNLHGVVGRVAGSVPDYDYGELLLAYGESGAVWGEENLGPYLQDPTGFLREATGEQGRSKMAFRVRQEQDARDLVAYLATFPAEGGAAAEEGEAAASE